MSIFGVSNRNNAIVILRHSCLKVTCVFSLCAVSEQMSLRSVTIADVFYEDDRYIFAVVDEEVPPERALPIDLPEEDRSDHFKGSSNTFRDSPFHPVLNDIIVRVRSVLTENRGSAGECPPNPWRVKGFMDYLQEKLFPFYPMWSMYMQRIVLCRVSRIRLVAAKKSWILKNQVVMIINNFEGALF